jgi:hypothetical protein
MSLLALSNVLDAALSIAVAAAAVIWLGVRAVRTLARKRAGGCACPSAPTCGAGKGPSASDLRAAAARATDRLNRGTPGRR